MPNFRSRVVFLLLLLPFLLFSPCTVPVWSKGERAAFESLKRNLVIVFPAYSASSSGPDEKAIGTGFFICLPCTRAGKNVELKFLVTCKHVVHEKSRVRLRFNSKTKGMLGSLVIDLRGQGNERNLFPASDKRVDLACILFDALPEKVDSGCFSMSQLLPESAWEAQDIGEGSMTVSLAPVYGYAGYSRNQFAVRYGRIALKSDEYWFNERDEQIFEKANLVDIGLNHGSSGSPVLFLPEQAGAASPASVKVLGVVKGATDVPSGRDLSTGSRVEIPLSVTALEPAESLKSLLAEIIKELAARGYALRKS